MLRWTIHTVSVESTSTPMIGPISPWLPTFFGKNGSTSNMGTMPSAEIGMLLGPLPPALLAAGPALHAANSPSSDAPTKSFPVQFIFDSPLRG